MKGQLDAMWLKNRRKPELARDMVSAFPSKKGRGDDNGRTVGQDLNTDRVIDTASARRSTMSVAFKLLAVLGAALLGAIFFIDRPYEQAPVHKGEADLSRWDCRHPVALDGTWLARGGTLDGGGASRPLNAAALPAWTPVTVPELWRHLPALRLGSGMGAVTYRLGINLPASCEHIMLEVPDQKSAVNIWADGELLSSVGRPSMTTLGERLRSLAVLASIKVYHRHTIIALEVSDHRNADGGITRHVVLGGDAIMRQRREGQLVSAALIAGALISMLVFTLAFGRADSTGSSPWMFCLLIIFIIREVCIADLLPKMVPWLDSDFVYRLETLCILLVWPIYYRVLRAEIGPGVSRLSRRVMDTLALLGVVAVSVLPESLLLQSNPYIYFFSIGCAAWCLVVVARSELGKGRSSIALTAGLVILIELMLHDFIDYRRYVPTTELAPGGILVLMFAHVIQRGRQMATALTNAQSLTSSLENANKDLDKRVQERTSALGEAVAELEAAKEKAETTVRIRTRYLSHLSHEIRNPLNIILGNVDLVRKQLEGQVAGDTLDTVRSIGNNLVALLDDALDVARVEAGTIQLRAEAFEPSGFLHELSEIYARQCSWKALNFEAVVDCPELLLVGDTTRIYQILSNILNNAVKFTTSGTVSLRATVRVQSPETALLQTEIMDTGPGIPAADHERIFSEFERGGTSSVFSGSGLGLAISRHLARAMGGDISVRSGGSTGSMFAFEVVLPWHAGQAVQTRFPLLTEEIEGSKSVLVVEDSLEGRVLLSEHAKLWGIRATCVASVPECLDALEDALYDAILLDMNLGPSSGLEVLSALRRHGSSVVALTPVIAVTANVLLEDVQAYLQAGVDSVISKPVNFDELYEAIRLVLGQTSTPPLYQDGLATLAIDRAAPAFVRTCVDYSINLSAAQAVGDVAQLLSIIHRLRGSAATFGYMELENACKMAESAVAVGLIDGYALDRLRLVLKLVK